MKVSEKKMPFLWQKEDSDRSKGSRQQQQDHSHHSTEGKLTHDNVGLVGKILNKTEVRRRMTGEQQIKTQYFKLEKPPNPRQMEAC